MIKRSNSLSFISQLCLQALSKVFSSPGVYAWGKRIFNLHALASFKGLKFFVASRAQDDHKPHKWGWNISVSPPTQA